MTGRAAVLPSRRPPRGHIRAGGGRAAVLLSRRPPRGHIRAGGGRKLLVFLKAPVPGKVKTRLAAAIGRAAAARAHVAMARQTAATAGRVAGVETVWVYEPAPGFPDLCWLGNVRGRVWRQASGDLGARISSAFARAFGEGAAAACAIGVDSPGLGAGEVRAAFRALRTSGSAVIPAADGGYCLIGLAREASGLFEGIPWSGPRVLEATRRRARRLGLSLKELLGSWDVDEPQDLVRWVTRSGRP